MSGHIHGTLEPKFNPFDGDYLIEILNATIVAWDRMKHPTASELEDQITNRLAGRLINDPYFAKIPYDVVAQYGLLGLNGERLGRLDIRFKHRNSQNEYFAFEAKRLHVVYPGGRFSTEYPTYAGNDGMMAFVEGYYSNGYSAGGMLGYVMDGRSDQALKGLRRRIQALRKTLKLITDSDLAQSALPTVIVEATDGIHLGETVHDLGTHSLRVFHLILPVQNPHDGVQV
jgi:hypothetical protein